MDGNGRKFDDWRVVSSPKGLVSEEFSMCEGPNCQKIVVKNEFKVEEEIGDFDENPSGLMSRGSIAERRAAKCGFNASRINVARFRSVTSPLSPPAMMSPYLTIPDGISPTALLDSPIMLPNCQAQQSPTTGTYPFPPLSHESLMLNSVTPAADVDRVSDVSSFSFKHDGGPVSLPCISDLTKKPPMDVEFPADYQKQTATNNCATDSSADEVKLSEVMILDANCNALKQSRHTITAGDQMSRFIEPTNGGDAVLARLLEGQQKEGYAPTGMLRSSEDGYNWRKYGQKQVKGSEYPRSYYKCTHPNCQVKKKVERSHDGQITEIIYKGAHNHPKPQPNRREILGSRFSFSEISGIESNGSGIKVEGGEIWRNIQLGCEDIKVGSDCRPDGLERTSSTSVLTEISDLLSNTQGKPMGVFESAGTPELSAFASHDGDEDGATQGSISLEEDADDGESESKRRRKDSCINETNLTSRATREPRIVVQIESEVDVLDDGYRWRKYGQKVVKGNPNPRSYYKCTSAGCPVRKHVERASHNLKSVITIYEGKHNHEVPVTKNSSQVITSSIGSLPPTVSSTRPTLTLARTSNSPKLEPQVQDLAPHFERNPAPPNEFLRPYILGNFGAEMKFGGSFVYPMKLPPLPNSMSFGSFVMNSNHSDPHTACSVSSVLPNFPFSLPMSITRSANMDMGGIDFNNKGKPMGSVQSFLDGQQLSENDVKFLKPKKEQDDNM